MARKFRVAFAVRDGDGDDRAFHAGEEHAGAFLDLERGEAGFKALGLVLHEARPVVGAGDDRTEVAHHLAAVADAEAEGVRAREEGGELVAGARIEEDALGPAFAGAERVAETESPAGDHAAKIFQGNAARQDIGHVDVDGAETGTGERGAHLDLAVDALLAEHGDGGFGFYGKGCRRHRTRNFNRRERKGRRGRSFYRRL